FWRVPIVAPGAGWAAARGGETRDARFVRGGLTWTGLTVFLASVTTVLSQDPRPLGLGFGWLLTGMAMPVAWRIGSETSLTGRRRAGLGLVQLGAGLFIAALGL